ncbi:MAG TPA: Sb-PDE family phosphodiesterase [Bacteroidales bacterium]|nr:Sb-PDE family phosphodiesterase [Bacteroidales bacterium]
MKKPLLIIMLAMIVHLSGFSQKKIINLPDIQGYVTLKCDFHIHTIFSDGDVWPTVRINEAIRDGLDAIAIADHLEYTPKKDFIPVDFNAAWKICENYARERNFILVHGAEITRKMPPGHFNALFINDANLIAKDSVWDSFEAAIKQGAFIQWNHPGWKSQQPDGIPRMYDIHRKLIANGWLHAIEFFNDSEYYPLVFRFCEENNLALTGNSDVHGVISEIYKGEENIHRPMTLVFAKERTHDALKEAMFAKRTMVFFTDKLVGREEFAAPFFNACIRISKPYFENEKNIFFEITNNSDVPFYLINGKENTPSSITLAPNAVTRVVISKKATLPLEYDVRNVITGEKKVLRVKLSY